MPSELKNRIITALILIPLVIALVLFLPSFPFSILTGLIVLLCAWEWSFFMGLKHQAFHFFYLVLMILILSCIGFLNGSVLLSKSSIQILNMDILYIACVFWILVFFLVILYPRFSSFWRQSIVSRGLMGILVLVPCWVAINFIRNSINGPGILLFLFVLIWGADIAAYFVGKKWGKHKLAPLVSPGKSVQGLVGALIVSIVIALIALKLFHMPASIWLAAIGLSIITVLFSIVGDLFESMMKRNVGLKDSGHLLPGHGGILDRIDSLTAAGPIFATGILLGKFFH